jgi:hypothetical protein
MIERTLRFLFWLFVAAAGVLWAIAGFLGALERGCR